MRLVDVDYLKEKGHYDDHDEFVVDYDDIKNAPTIDISKELICSVNVDTDEIIKRIKEIGWEHGRWLDRFVVPITCASDIEALQDAQCSNCRRWHERPYQYGFIDYKYCPWCGAKMDEVEE